MIVTGAGSGIGLACARGPLRDGSTVAATDIGGIPEELTADGNCLQLSFDISSEAACFDAVKATVERFGGIRAVIHFASIHHTKTWEEVTPEDFARVYAVNVTGSFLIARAAAREIREAGSAIVLNASGGVELGGVGGDSRGGPSYISSKAAIRGLTRSLGTKKHSRQCSQSRGDENADDRYL